MASQETTGDFTFEKAMSLMGSGSYTPNQAEKNRDYPGAKISGTNEVKKTAVPRPGIYPLPVKSERPF